MEHIIGQKFPIKVMPLIENAKKTIDIFVFDWRWYGNDPGCSVQLFNQTIVRAVRRGVRVRALVNSMAIVDILCGVGIQAKCPNIESLMHSKMMIIDEKDVIIGSHNYTQNAFTKNQEISTYLPNCDDVESLLKLFNNLYNNYG